MKIVLKNLIFFRKSKLYLADSALEDDLLAEVDFSKIGVKKSHSILELPLTKH